MVRQPRYVHERQEHNRTTFGGLATEAYRGGRIAFAELNRINALLWAVMWWSLAPGDVPPDVARLKAWWEGELATLTEKKLAELRAEHARRHPVVPGAMFAPPLFNPDEDDVRTACWKYAEGVHGYPGIQAGEGSYEQALAWAESKLPAALAATAPAATPPVKVEEAPAPVETVTPWTPPAPPVVKPSPSVVLVPATSSPAASSSSTSSSSTPAPASAASSAPSPAPVRVVADAAGSGLAGVPVWAWIAAAVLALLALAGTLT